MYFKRCLCWRDLRTASSAVAVLSLVTCFVQVLTTAAVLAAKAEEGLNFTTYDVKEQAIIGLYLGLALIDIITIICAFILLWGIEQGLNAKPYIRPWLVMAIIELVYELIVNIFYFYVAFDWRNKGTAIFGITWISYIVLPLAYWIVKFFLMILGISAVLTYYSIVAKERRYLIDGITEEDERRMQREKKSQRERKQEKQESYYDDREPPVEQHRYTRYFDDTGDSRDPYSSRDQYIDGMRSQGQEYYAANPYRY